MKFTLGWLKDFLDTAATLEQVATTLTAIGLEVENITDNSTALAPFVVAEIEKAEPHPQADKLRVCMVNDGQTVRQIVCGAPNARAGIKVVLAKEGVKIPANALVIKKTSIRNVESNGMLCSAAELGLSDESAGIIELPANAVLGSPAANLLGADDPVIDIAITPNRADCLGIYGVARDLAAAGIGTLKPLVVPSMAKGVASPISVRLDIPACPLFVGCMITGVKNGPSPDWLQSRLKAIGLRPISALVDITNFMTIAYGRPLHVFDANKLKGGIHVRYAREGETLLALNDKTYNLDDSMIAICDDSGVLGLGGIMGGKSTGCTEETTSVFLESALFDPAHIATTGRALSLDSDARYRFERGLDPEFAITGAQIAAAMITHLCGGSANELVVAGKTPEWKRSISFSPTKVDTLGGLTMQEADVHRILTALHFTVSGSTVTPPSWRADIEGEADLVEEILRISGYDNIPAVALPASQKSTLSPHHRRTALVRKALAANGLMETCNWAFVAPEHAKLFGGGDAALTLLNPISAELSVMRPNLLPHLLTAIKRNADRSFTNAALFEIGPVYENTTPAGQKLIVAGVRAGNAAPRNSFKTERIVDAFDAKADCFTAIAASGLAPEKLMIDRTVPSWYHPGRSGRISLGGKVTLGYFGEINPRILAQFGIESPAVAFEVLLDDIPLPKNKSKAKTSLAISNFQAVERDFAFIADEKLQAADVVKAIEGAEKQLIKSVQIFDLYSGKGIDAGKKSVALSVTLQAHDRTLTEAEIEAVQQKIIAGAQSVGLVLRS